MHSKNKFTTSKDGTCTICRNIFLQEMRKVLHLFEQHCYATDSIHVYIYFSDSCCYAVQMNYKLKVSRNHMIKHSNGIEINTYENMEEINLCQGLTLTFLHISVNYRDNYLVCKHVCLLFVLKESISENN